MNIVIINLTIKKMLKGKQIEKIVAAGVSVAEINAAAAGTLGAFLAALPAGIQKNVTFPAIVASGVGVKATNSALADKPLSLPTINVGADSTAGLVGDGVKVGVAFYVSADAGVTAKSLATMAIGDSIYANTTGAGGIGYPLDATDTLYVSYRA